FHFTGEGQVGDQTMTNGNRAIRDHAAQGRHLRLFEGSRGVVKYAGEMYYSGWYEDDAPETGDGPLREVIVFKLAPSNSDVIHDKGADSGIPTAPDNVAKVDQVDVESKNSETF